MIKLLIILYTSAVFTVVESNTKYYYPNELDLQNLELRYNDNAFWQAIVPGTKWCGDGDIAKDYDDLGIFKETDMCCRDHDHCDDVIIAGEEKNGLVNNGPFTRLNCKCDSAFYNCLKKVDKPSSQGVGTGYFNLGMGFKCYKFDYPAYCTKLEGVIKRCVEYEYDKSKPKSWQWFDLPFF